jgi:hypothetical protein
MAESFLFVKARCFGSKHKGEKQTAMAERRNVEFAVEGGVTLRAGCSFPAPKVPPRRLRWRTATSRNSRKRVEQPLPGSANIWTHQETRTMTERREISLPFTQTDHVSKRA